MGPGFRTITSELVRDGNDDEVVSQSWRIVSSTNVVLVDFGPSISLIMG